MPIKKCPFCGSALVYFGNGIKYEKPVTLYKYPEYKQGGFRCPLNLLVFNKVDWNRRV